MIKTIVFVILCSLFSIAVAAQTAVDGQVINEKGVAVEYANVVLLNVHDSAFMVGAVTDANGDFRLLTQAASPYLLRVSCIGYKTLYHLSPTPQLGNITLVEEQTGLEEVAVIGRQKVMQRKDGVLTMNIANSYLKDEASVTRLLAKVPGVLVSNGEITMFGKNNLEFYIGDRKASLSQVQSLLPTDIERIEVISMPGAEYSASTDAVIKIRLKKQKKDEIRVTLYEAATGGSRSFGNDAVIDLQIKTGKWSNRLYYNNYYSKYDESQRDKSKEYNYLKEYTNLNQREVLRGGSNKKNYVFYGGLYEFNDKNEIGFQYSGSFSTRKSFDDGMQTIYKDEEVLECREFHNMKENRTQLHNFSLNYTTKMKRDATFWVITDYAVSNIKGNNNVNEMVVATGHKNQFINHSTSDYQIFAINPQFQIPGKYVSVTTGAQYSMMKDQSKVEYAVTTKENLYDLKEHTAALYANVNIKTKPINVSVGLRGEYSVQSVSNKDDAQAKFEREYWNLFPYATVSKDFSDNINASISYRKFIKRPSFSMIDPTYIYKDTLSYTIGNPYIKPTLADMISLNLNVWNFSLDAGYYFYQNSTYLANIQDKDNPSILQSTYGNLPYHNRLFSCGISYSYTHRVVSVMGSIRGNLPYTKVPFKESIITLTRPIWLGQLSLDVNVTPTTSLFGSGTYKSSGDNGIIQFRSYYSVDLGVRQYLLKKQLLISASVYDLFDTKRTNRWSSNADYVRYVMDSNPYSRSFEILVRYIFGKTKKEIQQKSSSSDARNRM